MVQRETTAYDILKKVEELLAPTIVRIADMDGRIARQEEHLCDLPDIKGLLTTIAAAQTTMSHAAESMAFTFRKAEERQEQLEIRNQKAHELAAGRDQIPLKSHYYTLFAALAPTFVMCAMVVLYTLHFTGQNIKASLTKIEVNQEETQAKIEHAKKELEQKIK